MYKECPECGSENIWRDEVYVGVGTVCGPYHCNNCDWLEYDPFADLAHLTTACTGLAGTNAAEGDQSEPANQ
jgi:hypothetical protein